MVLELLEKWKIYRKEKKAMKTYGDYYQSNRKSIEGMIRTFSENHEKMAVWGGGLKGQAFLKTFDPDNRYINCVFDNDENKDGKALSTGHRILNMKKGRNLDIQVIFIMNCNHENEIAGKLIKEDLHVKLINMDSIIYGNLSTEEALQMYGGIL